MLDQNGVMHYVTYNTIWVVWLQLALFDKYSFFHTIHNLISATLSCRHGAGRHSLIFVLIDKALGELKSRSRERIQIIRYFITLRLSRDSCFNKHKTCKIFLKCILFLFWYGNITGNENLNILISCGKNVTKMAKSSVLYSIAEYRLPQKYVLFL